MKELFKAFIVGALILLVSGVFLYTICTFPIAQLIFLISIAVLAFFGFSVVIGATVLRKP